MWERSSAASKRSLWPTRLTCAEGPPSMLGLFRRFGTGASMLWYRARASAWAAVRLITNAMSRLRPQPAPSRGGTTVASLEALAAVSAARSAAVGSYAATLVSVCGCVPAAVSFFALTFACSYLRSHLIMVLTQLLGALFLLTLHCDCRSVGGLCLLLLRGFLRRHRACCRCLTGSDRGT